MLLEPHINRLRKSRWLLAALCFALPMLCSWGSGSFSGAGLLNQIIIGLILGSIYALIALGYTMVYGVIRLINFAHGDIYMLGAFTGYYFLRLSIRWLHFVNHVPLVWCFIISALLSAVTCAALAMLMERWAYRPLRRSTRIAALITAVGVSFLLENMGIIVFGPNPKSYEPKTLEVYQLQVCESADFAGARTYEQRDAAQQVFPATQFPQLAYARVRLVTKDGTSGWGPVLTIDPQETGGFAQEQPGATTPTAPQALSSIGYTRRTDGARQSVVLSWAQGAPADIQLSPVFSDAQGNQLAWSYPPGSPRPALRVPVFSAVIIGAAILLLWGLNLIIHHSKFGISMRALSFDLQAAKLMGVNTDSVIAWTFGIGGACAALAGNMVGIYNQSIEPLMGILPGLKAFVAAVVGGIGSIPGAAVGGLVMGLSESLVKGFIAPQWSGLADAMAFGILIVVLLFKPSGLFGQTRREKV